MIEIINKINNIIYFKLIPIITENKPGELVDLNLKNICKKLDIQFHFTKSFYINELNSKESRGKHSNDNCTELLICVDGTMNIKLHDGKNEYKFSLKKNEGIYIDKNIWIDFYNFKNAIVLVFVDVDYNKDKKSCYNFEDYLNKFK